MNILTTVALLAAALDVNVSLDTNVEAADLVPKDVIQESITGGVLTSLDVADTSLHFTFPSAGVVEAHARPVAYINDEGARIAISTQLESETVEGVTTWHARRNTIRFDATSEGRVRYWLAPQVGVRMQIVKITHQAADDSELDGVNATDPTVAIPEGDHVRWTSVLGSGVSIDYRVRNGRIKDAITIETPPTIPSTAVRFAVIWQWQAMNLTPAINGNGAVVWSHPVRGPVFRFKPLYVYDAAGNVLRSQYVLRGDKLGFAVHADDMRNATYPVVIDPDVDTDDASDSVTIGDSDYEGYKAFIKITLPDLSAADSIDSAALYLYCSTGNSESFYVYADEESGSWSSASSYATLNALTFGTHTEYHTGSVSSGWGSYNVSGSVGGTNGVLYFYDQNSTGGAITCMLKGTASAGSDTWTYGLTIGDQDMGDEIEFQPHSGVNPPYITITYSAAGGGSSGAHHSGSSGVLMVKLDRHIVNF